MSLLLSIRIQEKSLGGSLKPATRRLLSQFAHDGAAAAYTGRGAIFETAAIVTSALRTRWHLDGSHGVRDGRR